MQTPPLFLPDSLYNSMLNRQRRACRLQLHAAGGRGKLTLSVAVIASASVSRINVKVYNIFTVFTLTESKCKLRVYIAVKHIYRA